MADIPNLAGVATAELVEKIGGGNFQASYINWSRTLNLLRQHAPGWLPETVPGELGLLHKAPHGAYMLIRFRHADGTTTPEVPQAVMDTRNAAVPWDKITARDITDTHRRGVCLAAALTFGLAYELWAKVALESGYHDAEPEPEKPTEKPSRITPMGDTWDKLTEDEQAQCREIAATVMEYAETGDYTGAWQFIATRHMTNEVKAGAWSLLSSNVRTALKKAQKEAA